MVYFDIYNKYPGFQQRDDVFLVTCQTPDNQCSIPRLHATFLHHLRNCICGWTPTGRCSIFVDNQTDYFSIAICGASICGTNFCVNITKRSSVCLQTWVKYDMQQNENNTQAFILFTAPLVMVTIVMISCYYTADAMFAYTDSLAESLLPFALGGKRVEHMIYMMLVIISELILLATSLYAALVCSTIMEIYVCVTAFHQDLLTICAQQHVSEQELQTWRRKFRCQEKVLRSVNDYLGRSVLVLLVMCLSILILTIFKCIGEKAVNPALMLFICNAVTVICGLTLPSAILNGKVGTNIMGTIHLI